MSQLKSKIMDDVKAAMKNKEADRLSAIRFLQAAIKNKEIDVRPNTITDEDIMGVIKKMAKQRKDSIEQFEKGNRDDLAQREKEELAILEVYLPAQASREDVEAAVDRALASLGDVDPSKAGIVVGAAMKELQGNADGAMVKEVVAEKLS